MVQNHIAVVGAGLLGRLLAWQLLENGHRVSLYEAGSFERTRCAAFTAAAMISPLSEVVISERKIYDLGIESLALWPQWIDQLNAHTEKENCAKVEYCNRGSIVVAHSQDAAELQQFKQDLVAKLGEQDSSRWLNRQQLIEKESALEHFQSGLWLPNEAYLDNRTLLARLLERIQTLGGDCVEHCVAHIKESKIILPNRNDDFDWIIDCRGMGAKADLAEQAFDKDPSLAKKLRGVRGEVMWVETKEIALRHAIRLMHPRYKLYIVPKPQHRFIIGATEIESEDLSPISVQSNLELASALYTVNPAFAEARVIETDINLRPAFADNLPDIIHNDRVIHVNGLYRHGFLLAPALIQKIIVQLQFDGRPRNYPVNENPHSVIH